MANATASSSNHHPLHLRSNDANHHYQQQSFRKIRSSMTVLHICVFALIMGAFMKPCHLVKAFALKPFLLPSSLPVEMQHQPFSTTTQSVQCRSNIMKDRRTSVTKAKLDNHVEQRNHDKNKAFSSLPRQHDKKEEMKSANDVSNSRRNLLVFSSSILLSSIPILAPQNANAAIPFLPSSEPRRQLELCLVTILRVQYWAESISTEINDKLLSPESSSSSASDFQKQPFLEARLGAKALLTGRIGGGATSKVYTLASLQLKGCIKDAQLHHTDLYKSTSNNYKLQKFTIDNAATQMIESLGSVVEFDGLETTTDPSPRSSLMLSMYTVDKARFVKRMLSEQTVPACQSFLKCFDGNVRKRCEEYVYENYRSEMPLKRQREIMSLQFSQQQQ